MLLVVYLYELTKNMQLAAETQSSPSIKIQSNRLKYITHVHNLSISFKYSIFLTYYLRVTLTPICVLISPKKTCLYNGLFLDPLASF